MNERHEPTSAPEPLTESERAGGWHEDGVWLATEGLVLGLIRSRVADAVARARAEAWDEGARSVWEPLSLHAYTLDYYLDDNPYRAGEGR